MDRQTAELPQNKEIRLNQFVARAGYCSRRKADDWIQAGRIAVDGIICKQVGVKVDPQKQRVTVDGKAIEKPALLYIAINKPRGVVTTKMDPQGRKTVMDLLPREFDEAGVFPIGRLDRDSEGLLLLTNDGEWSNILMHPSHQVWKEYRVLTNRPLSAELKNKLEKGIELEGKKTFPARIRKSRKKGEHYEFHIALREGRNRQVRRMCTAVGMDVLQLTRVSIGPIQLNQLAAGEWKQVERKNIDQIFELQSVSSTETTHT